MPGINKEPHSFVRKSKERLITSRSLLLLNCDDDLLSHRGGNITHRVDRAILQTHFVMAVRSR
jgi:hypothetical protein